MGVIYATQQGEIGIMIRYGCAYPHATGKTGKSPVCFNGQHDCLIYYVYTSLSTKDHTVTDYNGLVPPVATLKIPWP